MKQYINIFKNKVALSTKCRGTYTPCKQKRFRALVQCFSRILAHKKVCYSRVAHGSSQEG